MNKEHWVYALVGFLAGIIVMFLLSYWTGWGMMSGLGGYGWHNRMMGSYYGYGPGMMSNYSYPTMYYNENGDAVRLGGPGMMYWSTTSTQK